MKTEKEIEAMKTEKEIEALALIWLDKSTVGEVHPIEGFIMGYLKGHADAFESEEFQKANDAYILQQIRAGKGIMTEFAVDVARQNAGRDTIK